MGPVHASFLGATAAFAAFVGNGAIAQGNLATPEPQSCDQQVKELSDRWRGMAFSPEADPVGQMRSYGWKNHAHSKDEATVVELQLSKAARLCEEGKQHEAMLRMDVVRAILRLPAVEHPSSHGNTVPTPR
jgi:hypothetical protein